MNRNWLRHAFALDAVADNEPNETQRLIVERVCKEIVRRKLTTPALLLLEMGRPLNYVSAQFLHFVQPFATVLTDVDSYQQLTLFLEKRGSVDYICRRLEALEHDAKD